MSHVTAVGERKLQSQLNDATEMLKQQSVLTEQLEEKLKMKEKELIEEKEQYRWKEVQFQQQIEVGEHKNAELRTEIGKLKSQVHDLRVYNSALRTGNNRGSSSKSTSRNWSSSAASLARSVSRSSRASLESLDSGPRSLGSEDGEAGTWREARLGSSFSLQTPIKTSKSNNKIHSSLPPFVQSASTVLPPLSATSQSRPSTSVTLPPISQSQNVTRPHIRRQLRLSSAPVLNLPNDKSQPKNPRQVRDPL